MDLKVTGFVTPCKGLAALRSSIQLVSKDTVAGFFQAALGHH